MKRSLLIIIGFALMIGFSFAFTQQQVRYKNLKVLPKNINKHQLDSVMTHFTVALGVKCNFCHVKLNDEKKSWDFASDDNNHKLIARQMMKMTEKINKNYFDVKIKKDMTAKLEVTCYTCHNGKAHPATFPAPPAAKKQ